MDGLSNGRYYIIWVSSKTGCAKDLHLSSHQTLIYNIIKKTFMVVGLQYLYNYQLHYNKKVNEKSSENKNMPSKYYHQWSNTAI